MMVIVLGLCVVGGDGGCDGRDEDGCTCDVGSGDDDE